MWSFFFRRLKSPANTGERKRAKIIHLIVEELWDVYLFARERRLNFESYLQRPGPVLLGGCSELT